MPGNGCRSTIQFGMDLFSWEVFPTILEYSIFKYQRVSSLFSLVSNIKFTFYDERFSSDVIFKELRKQSISISKIKNRINHMAASYILQGFLDTNIIDN